MSESTRFVLSLGNSVEVAVNLGHMVTVYIDGIRFPIEKVDDISLRDDGMAVITAPGREFIVRPSAIIGICASDGD